MAETLVNSTLLEAVANTTSGIVNQIQLFFGGIVGIYIIYVIFIYFSRKKEIKLLKEIRDEIHVLKEELKRKRKK